MAEERVVRREVHEQTVDGGAAATTAATSGQVTRETHTVQQTEQTVPATTVAPGGVTNVNVTKPAPAVTEEGAVVGTGGNVSINTPDGTQVNVNG